MRHDCQDGFFHQTTLWLTLVSLQEIVQLSINSFSCFLHDESGVALEHPDSL